MVECACDIYDSHLISSPEWLLEGNLRVIFDSFSITMYLDNPRRGLNHLFQMLHFDTP